MPDIHRGQQPGVGMTLHISVGISILNSDRAAIRMAAVPSRRTREHLAALAAPELRACALDALYPGTRDDLVELAVCIIPRLGRVVLLSVSAANAGCRQRLRREGD